MPEPLTSKPPERQDFALLAADRRQGLVPSRARSRPSAGSMARRRWAIRLAKLGLPLVAAGLFGLILFWPEIDGRDARLSFRRAVLPAPEALQVLEPRYHGVDEMSRPFTVTARAGRVVRDEPSQEVLLLDLPKADILLSDGGWVYLESRNGRYDRPARLLDLEGDVTVFHDNGMMFRTEQAAVRVEEGAARGDTPTRAQGPFGTIHSEGFEMTERGAVIIFTGRAHAVLEAQE